MPDRTCAVCVQPMPATSRSDAAMCSNACRTWRRRHPGVPRPLGSQSYQCELCSKQFTRDKVCGKRPRFCNDTCWEAFRHRQRPFGEWRKADPYPPREFICEDCGTGSRDSGHGPAATRCIPCSSAHAARADAAWQRRNVGRAYRTKAAWAEANRDACRARLRAFYRAHPERYRAYQIANADRVRGWKRDRENRRRARKASVASEVFTSQEIFDRDRWVCGICQQVVDPSIRWPDGRSASLDHVLPISRGGPHTRANVQLAHLSCNMQKGASVM